MLAAFPITEEVGTWGTGLCPRVPPDVLISILSRRARQAYIWEATWPSVDMAMQVARRAVMIQ